MKKMILALTLITGVVFAMTIFGGKPELVQHEPSSPEKVVEGNNAFMMKVYGILSHDDDNIFISPYSISSALAMTFAGSSGNTEREMTKALEFSANNNDFHKNFGEVTDMINKVSEKGELELSIANSLWLQEGYRFLDEFLRINKTFYKTETANLNFGDSERSRKIINDWVSEKTKEKIKDLIPEGILDALTRLVLTNAVYFKAEWQEHFPKGNTQKSEFFISENEAVPVEMMYLSHRFDYMENDEVQFIEMPYKGGDASMFVLLPKNKNGLKEIEKKLTHEKISEYESILKRKDVRLHFPKFKMSLEYELKKIMADLGMNDAFNEKADFSKMNGKTDLYISAIIHKTFVAVDEKGTEAAAATAVVMRMKSAMPSEDYAVFRADHPFFYYIKEKSTGAILFAGRVTDPSE